MKMMNAHHGKGRGNKRSIGRHVGRQDIRGVQALFTERRILNMGRD